MAYTAFRKSYGDFDVVIPAVDFSSLTIDEAKATARRLKAYVNGFVCHHLQCAPAHQTRGATGPITYMIRSHAMPGCASVTELVRSDLGLDDSYFRVFEGDGVALRKSWCNHMADEIEREFGLEEH